ncbi:MAG: hypothetical protein FJY97_21380, partial [candidate division Zixibacteria bacterium]|nr:hypothetical protein [candidate division Zixibacteria bacterium]
MTETPTFDSTATSPSAVVMVHADRVEGPPISRLLFGKFTEHLGRNVYGGAWAETIENPWFATIDQWPDPETVRRRFEDMARTYQLAELQDWSDKGVAAWWMPHGPIQAALDRGLRGYAQRLTTSGPGAGIRTLVFLPFHRQRGIHLSVRGRSNKTTRAFVRLMTLHGVEVAWADVPLHRGGWQTVERTLHRAPARQLAPGTPILVDLQLEHPTTVWLDRCSLIPSDNRYGWDPEVIGFMKEANLPLLRFPGGNFVSGYHWKDGVGLIDDRPILPNPAWPEIEWNDVGTDEWMQLCHLVGCASLICVNAGNGTPQEAAEWVEYCNGGIDTPMGAYRAANGHPQPYDIRYWEIGNELYGEWQIGHSTAETYAERYLAFRKAMLEADPTIQIIANGHDAAWNEHLVSHTGDKVRSISVHTLVGYRIPAEADPEAVFKEYMGYAADYGNHLAALAAPMQVAGIVPRLAITELSIFTLKPQLPNVDNLSEALYYSGIVHAAIRSRGLVELISHSALINHSAGLTKHRGVVYPHPFWWALHLYGTHSGIQPVEVVVEGPTFSCSGAWLTSVADIPVIDAVALLSEDTHTLALFLCNRDLHHTTTVRIRLDGFS